MRLLAPIIVLVALLTAAGCADDNSGDDRGGDGAESAPVTTAEEPATTTDVQEAGTQGETADLPVCDATGTVRPCRTESGAVLQEGGEGGGEVSDLPLCAKSPPPCRNPDGSFEEP